MFILTDENFEKEITDASKPILVDFWASWCSPCLILGPILEKVVKGIEGKVILTKVSTEAAPKACQKYGIEKIPTVVLFNKGKIISSFVGLRAEALIREWLEDALKENSD